MNQVFIESLGLPASLIHKNCGVSHKLEPQLFAVIERIGVVHVRQVIVPRMEKIVELSVRVRLTLVNEVREFQDIVFVVTIANQCWTCEKETEREREREW